MIKFSSFLFEDDYYYHGTKNSNVDSILKSGLDPNKSLYSGKIYMTTNHGLASKYSKDGKGNLGTILKIKKSAIDHSKIGTDGAGVITYTDKINPEHIEKM